MAKQVTLYGTPTCPWCQKAKQFLKENNIPFEDVNVAADRARGQEMMRKSGQMGVPVLDIDGKIVIGFDRDEITGALGL